MFCILQYFEQLLLKYSSLPLEETKETDETEEREDLEETVT